MTGEGAMEQSESEREGDQIERKHRKQAAQRNVGTEDDGERKARWQPRSDSDSGIFTAETNDLLSRGESSRFGSGRISEQTTTTPTTSRYQPHVRRAGGRTVGNRGMTLGKGAREKTRAPALFN